MVAGLSAVLGRLRDRLGVSGCVALVSALAWLARYASRFGLGFGRPYWADSFDQLHYLISTTALAHGDLTPAQHIYPLLYPLLAVPFLLIDPLDPYFLLDWICFTLTMVAAVRVAGRLGIGAVPATAMALLACLGQIQAARGWMIPWTTTLSAALIWWTIERTLALLRPERAEAPRSSSVAILGALAGALVATRPVDALAAMVCLPVAAMALILRGRFTPRAVLCVIAGGLAVVGPVGALHLAIYGPHASDYLQGTSNTGFQFADLPWKISTIVISARPWFPDTRSIIETMPWLVAAAAGTLLTLRRQGPARGAVLLILAVALPYSLLYLAFGDLLATGIFGYGNFHYFKWLLPFAAMMLWVWLTAFRTMRGAMAALAALMLVILLTCIRPLPERLGPDRPARMLVFRGSTTRAYDEAYFAKVTLPDRRGLLWNTKGMHQIPDAQGERIIAITRLIEPGALRTDPGESPAFPQPQAPDARYGVRLSVGIPCWIRHAACRMPPAR